MKRLFIDLETCETTNESIKQDIADKIKHPGNITKSESIIKWEEDRKPQAIKDAVKKTSFSGLQGEIICIGYAVDNGEVRIINRAYGGNSEEMLLKNFFHDVINEFGDNFNPEWVGHNLAEFDLRFLFHRCVINNVKPAIDIPYNEKPWGRSIFDTLYETTGNNKCGGSLDAISKAFGLEGKLKGFDGSMVNQAWLDGENEKIAEYCKQDVNTCRDIYKKLNFIKKVGE